MPRLTYADIWETQQPWPDGSDVLGTIVRFQRGRAPCILFTQVNEHQMMGQMAITMPVFVHPMLGLVGLMQVVPQHLHPVMQARCTLLMQRYHDFDVDVVMEWGKTQEPGEYTKLLLDAKLSQVELDRVTRGEDPFWTYVADAFGLDPAALPPLATARTARFWSAQVSAD